MKITKTTNVYENSWINWNDDILQFCKIPSMLYHVTSLRNLPNIFRKGLTVGQPKASKNGYNKGIYLTSNPNRLIETSKDMNWTSPQVVSVVTQGLTLKFDPEFYHDYFDNPDKLGKLLGDGKIDFYMYSEIDIPKSNIVNIRDNTKQRNSCKNCGMLKGCNGDGEICNDWIPNKELK